MQALTVTRPPAAAGMAWLNTGFRLFSPNVVPWMGMTAAFFMVAFALSLIPLLGPAMLELLSPFMVAAYMAAAEAAQRGQPTGLIHIGAGYFRGRNALLVIGVAYMLASLLVGLVVKLIAGDALPQFLALMADPQAADAAQLREVLDAITPALLVGSLMFVPLLMATWFAPALALFHGFAPDKALLWSFWACLVNWRPFMVYGLLLSLAAMVAVIIPFGLGFLVLMPVAMTSTYAAYQGVFVPREDAPV